MKDYRALLMDYGGVMTTSMSVSFGAFCVANDVDPRLFSSVLAEAYARGEGRTGSVDGIVALVETGRITQEEFDERLAVALSEGRAAPLDPTDLSIRLFQGLRPEPRMRAAVVVARDHGIRAALVSNTWGVHPLSEMDDVFDAVVLSGREGIRKPDPEIYLLTAFRLGVKASACVLVDDIPANVAGADAVGMTGVLHRDPAITIPKLEALLGFAIA